MTKTKEVAQDYALQRLTDLPTINYTRLQNSAAWKSPLTAQEYVDREHVLGLSKIASSDVNRLAVFGLLAKDRPDTLVSSIELLIREAWRFHRNGDGLVTKTNVLSGCIGGVFTYPDHRGKGIATIMVDKLLEVAQQPQYVGPDGFIFLYSEVGEYYTRNGFKSFDVPLLNVPLSQSSVAYAQPDDVTLIKYHQFGGLLKQYAEHFEKEMTAKVADDGIDRISVNPTADFIDWFHLRAKYLSTKLFHTDLKYDPYTESYEQLVEKFSSVEPFFFGLQLTCPESGELKGFIVWQYDFSYDKKEEKLNKYATVIKIFVNTPKFDQDSVQLALITQMKRYLEAKHSLPVMSDFQKIVVWQSEISESVLSSLVTKHAGIKGLENGSRSAIRYNNPELDKMVRDGSLLWENNSKFPWF